MPCDEEKAKWRATVKTKRNKHRKSVKRRNSKRKRGRG